MDKKYEDYEKNEFEKLESRLKNLATVQEPAQSVPQAAASAKSDTHDIDDVKTDKLVEQLLKEIKVDDGEKVSRSSFLDYG